MLSKFFTYSFYKICNNIDNSKVILLYNKSSYIAIFCLENITCSEISLMSTITNYSKKINK